MFKKYFILILFCFFIFGPSLSAETGDVIKEPKVRVLVEENQKLVRLESKGPYQIFLMPSLKVVQSGSILANTPITPTPTGIKFGNQEWATQTIRIVPKNDRDLILDTTRFRGFIEISKDKSGSLQAINHIGIESYLCGVLPHEVPHWWPIQTLKSQAVAARTYALYQMTTNRAAAFDLKSSTGSQVYGGSNVERYRSQVAVNSTKSQVLLYEGKVFPAFFNATCAGKTAGAQELWKINLLPIQGGTVCSYCKISPHYLWDEEVSLALIEEKFNKYGHPIGQIIGIEIISQTPSGRVGSIRVTGTLGVFVIAAKDFRVWLGGDKIKSTHFGVTIEEDKAHFRGKGWGHGVGLCQWGALGQAILGHSYEKILSFYYPGSTIGSYNELMKPKLALPSSTDAASLINAASASAKNIKVKPIDSPISPE